MRISATECVGKVHLIKDDYGKIGGSFEIISKGNNVWVRFDAGFSKWIKAEYDLPAGKWLHGTPSTGLTKILVSHCDHQKFTSPDKGDSGMKKLTATTLEGVPVSQVTSQGSGGEATFSIANTGKPYLLKRKAARPDLADISYLEFGKPVDAKAPSGEITEAPTR